MTWRVHRRLLWLFRTKARRRCTLIATIVLVWLIDQRGQPIWARPDSRPVWQVSQAWIHQTRHGLVLRDEPQGHIGIVRHLRAVQSMDGRPLATEVSEFRRLSVKIHQQWVGEPESGAWRSRLALHNGNPAVLLPDLDITRILWLGYPADWMAWLTFIVCLVGVAAMPVLVVRFIGEVVFDPNRETSRQRALRRGLCPECGYTILHLPQPRCPECGETWRRSEERPLADKSA